MAALDDIRRGPMAALDDIRRGPMAASATIETGGATTDTGSATTTAIAGAWPLGDLLRDIARGGLAGLVVGVIVGGIGGRLAMRFAALAVPEAVGSATQNGNRIGDITLDGTLALVVFVGLFAGVAIGVIWVTVSPWIPGEGLVRGLLVAPLAIAFGAFGLIEEGNPDFIVLRHSPTVILILLVTVAMVGLAVSVLDTWLERRLPRADAPGTRAATAYAVIAAVGLMFLPLLVLPSYLATRTAPLGGALAIVGAVTLAWWYRRWRGATRPSIGLLIAARGALLISTVAGFVVLAPALSEALRLA
jgi:hypothetical protein